MKKKIVSLALVAALAAICIVGASLAYFTDTDEKTNTFTAGGVKIELIEQQRDKVNGTLETFENDKMLYPIVGSAQGEKDKWGMPVAKNYLDKIITVKNLDQDAYIRVYVATPKNLLAEETKNNPLHSNLGNRFMPNGDFNADTNNQNADFYANWKYDNESFETKIDGIDYVVDYYTYKKALTKDEVTGSACIVGFYLDKDVNTRTDENGKTIYTITKNGVTSDLDFDFSKGVKIPVYAVGVQADGFDDADAAIEAAFGKNFNPWK